MKLFDSHCHLDDPVFAPDLDAVLDRFSTAGGAGLMIAGIDEKSCRAAVRLAETRDFCWAAVGVHPHHASECTEESLEALIRLAAHPKVRAWGEIGLDFNRMYSPIADQEKWLERQIEAAGALELPIIFHERDSGGRFLELLRAHADSGLKGVVHCFSGNRRELEAYLELGLCIGVTGIVTLQERGAGLRELIPAIPETRLLAETDAPWLTPSPERNRFRRNEPAFVSSVVLRLAALMDRDPDQLAQTLFDNARRLFQFSHGR
jgi:TatD DNase family protein